MWFMLKAVLLLKRRPGMTHEDFVLEFRVHHLPLLQGLPGVRRAVVSDAIAGPGGRPAYDGVAEFWFDDLDDVRALVASSEAQDAEARLAEFVDMDAYETFLTVEHEVDLAEGRPA